MRGLVRRGPAQCGAGQHGIRDMRETTIDSLEVRQEVDMNRRHLWRLVRAVGEALKLAIGQLAIVLIEPLFMPEQLRGQLGISGLERDLGDEHVLANLVEKSL